MNLGAWGRRSPRPLLMLQTGCSLVEAPSAAKNCSSVMSQNVAGSRAWLQEKLLCRDAACPCTEPPPSARRAGAAPCASLPFCGAEPPAPEPQQGPDFLIFACSPVQLNRFCNSLGRSSLFISPGLMTSPRSCQARYQPKASKLVLPAARDSRR